MDVRAAHSHLDVCVGRAVFDAQLVRNRHGLLAVDHGMEM